MLVRMDRDRILEPMTSILWKVGITGAVVWIPMGLFNARSSQPGPAYTNYVNRCLQDKGYEVTGWQ